MEKLQKEIENCLLEEVYNPMFNFITKGIESNVTCVPLLAEKLMSLMTKSQNYGNEQDKYCSQDIKIGDQIGKAIKFYRNKKGITQKELGILSYKAEITIRRYEIGNAIPAKGTVVLLAKALGVSINELISFGCDSL